MIVVWAGTSDLVSEPIGQTTTTALMRLVLAAYPVRSFLELGGDTQIISLYPKLGLKIEAGG